MPLVSLRWDVIYVLLFVSESGDEEPQVHVLLRKSGQVGMME